MPTPLIHYEDASPEVRAVFDDIKATRNVADVNNFWKALAIHPQTLARTWASLKQVMADGALDAFTKELVYIAVSATNGCDYCTTSHTAAARKRGLSDAQWGELVAVIGMANETNRIVQTLRVPLDESLR